ncbi:TadE/TadG family type IV pilus assembly protein [Bradyrhizobium murdochi]|uniref:TadE/TadG family type IV pilus assembly protein n=1 Tax=Bradyrhizobium murdochi TaxID=1038859 RepID=UPI000422B357|nr:TadE/TadG family type IV pilus assembly protein [Bradyrhizobium murdochi]
MQKMSLRVRSLLDDRSGLAAVEFAMILPMMVVMVFGVVEISSAISVDRKATLAARTLSDLTSQTKSVADADLKNFGQAAKAIMTPYPASPLISSITQVYVDASGVAKVQWSKGLTIDASGNVDIAAAPHNKDDIVTLPSTLVVAKGTYVIWSKVSYKYTPAVGYVLAKTGLTFNGAAYTRPRTELCITYPTGGYATCQGS